jgi:hypothetical protein
MEAEIQTFFRHCPACGHRFEIHLIGKKLEDENVTKAKITPPTLSMGGLATAPDIYASSQPGGFRVLEESIQPTIIDAKDFDYTYKCGHCGHVWHELRPVEAELGLPKGGEDELVGEDTDGPTEEEAEEDEAADQA